MEVSRLNNLSDSLQQLYQIFEKTDLAKQTGGLSAQPGQPLQPERNSQPVPGQPEKRITSDEMLRKELANVFDIKSGLNVYNIV